MYRVLLKVLGALMGLLMLGCETDSVLKAGDAAPAFSALDIRGRTTTLAGSRGRVVVLYFWTNSCCGDSLKLIEPFYRANKNIEIVAVNNGDAKESVVSYAQSNKITFPMLTDDSTLQKLYGVFGFPTVFVIDKHGIIREKILGDVGNKRLEKIVQRLLNLQRKAEEAYEKTHSR